MLDAMPSAPHDHYFAGTPAIASSPRTIDVAVRGVSLQLTTDTGVFSGRALDPGTRVLLEKAPLPAEGSTVLDLGCGYGPVAAVLASSVPQLSVWAVDVNERALDLTRRNAAALGLDGVTAAPPDAVPDGVRFDAIYSNPPIRIGKAALHALLLHWLSRLTPEGYACLVVARNLGADSLSRWLEQQGHPTSRLGSRAGYRLLRVSAGVQPV